MRLDTYERRVLQRVAQVIHSRELAGHLPGWLVAAIDAWAPYRPEDGCGCCYGDGHEGECCPGWIHSVDPLEVQRCDDCALYPDDGRAVAAHAATCGCNWGGLYRCERCGSTDVALPDGTRPNEVGPSSRVSRQLYGTCDVCKGISILTNDCEMEE